MIPRGASLGWDLPGWQRDGWSAAARVVPAVVPLPKDVELAPEVDVPEMRDERGENPPVRHPGLPAVQSAFQVLDRCDRGVLAGGSAPAGRPESRAGIEWESR